MLPEWLKDCIPFMVTTSTGHRSVHVMRVVEILIAAALISWFTAELLKKDIEYIKRDLAYVSDRVTYLERQRVP